jgi:CHAT domain-containing protein/tetratricopeptide (TPR) repeat protein
MCHAASGDEKPRSMGARVVLTLLLSLGGVAAAAAMTDPALTQLRARVAESTSDAQRVGALWSLADALAARGEVLEAERTLTAAAALSGTPEQSRGTALRLSEVLTAGGNLEEAHRQLDTVAADSLSPSDLIALREAQGNLAVRNGDLTGAETAFNAAADAARANGADAIRARDLSNALRARLDRNDIAGLEKLLRSLDEAIAALPPGEERAILELALGDLDERAVREFRSPVSLRERAYLAFSHARGEAATVATRAYAAGLLGALYEDQGRPAEALRLTSEAVFLAQSVDAQSQLYRWQSQAGRLERKQGMTSAAADSFDGALFTLSGIRADVLASSRQAYASRVEPVYLDYADVHLRQAAALADGSAEQQQVLRDVRDQLESLKRAEVQDYFDNGCVTSGASEAKGINIPGAAVVYPILLADRIEVLIETGGTLRRFSSPVSRGEITANVRRLRLGIEQPSAGDSYRKPAEALYHWLLGDAAPWLETQKVDTLVFVPSGPLRTIPLAVLYDGKQFLIERFAVATTPAITLIPTLASAPMNRVLLAGLTESVQGFVGLPSVDNEMRTIGAIFPGESLENQTFSLASIRTDLSKPGFTVAHLATHGEFSADHRQSFILTFDSRLTMDGLQTALGRREDPLDLLVLSACSTAAGDDRAALGLAGVAIQAGAKSALASLWSISDEATAALMGSFYKSRKAGGESKAQSLRDSQLALLHSAEFKHPSYWAPYLLIGNWL